MTIGTVWLAATAAFKGSSGPKATTRSTFENQFGRTGEDLGRFFVHPSVLDDHILALGESELAQFSKKDRIIRSKKHVVWRGN
jgi:hypothetical protein